MLNTFLGKFTFFFWLSFFLVNIPIYVFGVAYMKDMLKASEEEKISLMVYTLKPVISLNLSFNQFDELHRIFENILDQKHINSIQLTLSDNTHPRSEYSIAKEKTNKNIYFFQTIIVDPFDKKEIASFRIGYENTYLNHLNNKLLLTFFFMFFTATVMFFLFFLFFIRKDFNALSHISNKLLHYLHEDKFEPIEKQIASQEITTIVNAVNNVIEKNVHYVEVLKVFNAQLEENVAKKASKLLQQEELMIHQSRQAAMGEMLESIAHQWRQPLNIIGLATTKLDLAHQFKQMTDETLQEVIETVSYNINYMSDTIDDFRNFTHPNVENTHFKAEKSFQDLLKILGAQLKNNSIEYNLTIEESIEVYGVENEFQQVTLIMVNNSIDAIKSQMKNNIKREFAIDIKVFKKENNSIIQIKDNGGGIKEENLPSIFNAYFSTKFSSQGTGIGLHIVKNIIESRMKGSIDVENINNGCCFTITLPNKIKTQELTP